MSAPARAGARAVPGLQQIQAPVQDRLEDVARELQRVIVADFPMIEAITEHLLRMKGKMFRPTLTLLASAVEGRPEPRAIPLAAVVELVHLATLVHDDIMDDADVRRSRRTASREYGSTAAVLLGDALFAHALHLATQFPTTEICAAVSESTRRVCAGEIVQTLRRGTTNITRADYQRIVDLKTAELFRVSCFLGARLAAFPPAYVDAASRFGRHLGIAYQIYDDLVDFFGEEKRIGKTLGTDLASGKLTLPLLVLLERLPTAEAAALTSEIAGERPPQLALRLQQMNEFGVFGVVADAVQNEVAAASAALRDWPDEAPTPLLLELCDVLRAQVAGLQRAG